MASKGNVRKIVDNAFGPAVGAVVAVLLATPLDSGETPAAAVLNAWPALLLGVAAGVGVIGATWLLTLLGRKVRPWFRTRSTRLKDLAPEIEELYGFQTPTKTDDLLLLVSYHQRCDELIAKLEKLGVPAPTRGAVCYLALLPDRPIRLRNPGRRGEGKGSAQRVRARS